MGPHNEREKLWLGRDSNPLLSDFESQGEKGSERDQIVGVREVLK